jgi:hypothetical protein
MLFISDAQDSPLWEPTVMWLLAEGFGYLFLRTVASRMAGNGTSSVPLPEAGQDTPASAWWRSYRVWADPLNAYQRMTGQAAAALAVGWGFGEEQVAAIHNAQGPDGDVGDEEPLLPASGNIIFFDRERSLRTVSREEPEV